MATTILIMEYDLGEAQRGLSPEAWRERANQIASLPGLRRKYWLRKPGGDERGGVYLFETAENAERGAQILAGSLKAAGANNVRHSIFDVDPDLTAITEGLL